MASKKYQNRLKRENEALKKANTSHLEWLQTFSNEITTLKAKMIEQRLTINHERAEFNAILTAMRNIDTEHPAIQGHVFKQVESKAIKLLERIRSEIKREFKTEQEKA
jgi:hypothetical protein